MVNDVGNFWTTCEKGETNKKEQKNSKKWGNMKLFGVIAHKTGVYWEYKFSGECIYEEN